MTCWCRLRQWRAVPLLLWARGRLLWSTGLLPAHAAVQSIALLLPAAVQSVAAAWVIALQPCSIGPQRPGRPLHLGPVGCQQHQRHAEQQGVLRV